MKVVCFMMHEELSDIVLVKMITISGSFAGKAELFMLKKTYVDFRFFVKGCVFLDL